MNATRQQIEKAQRDADLQLLKKMVAESIIKKNCTCKVVYGDNQTCKLHGKAN
jgi:hypothetical protein